MAKSKKEPGRSPEVQASGAGRGGNVPPPEHRWQPGQSGNPEGRRTAGATIREHMNSMAEAGLTEAQVRKIARDADEPWPRRTAALTILRTVEGADLADYEPWLKGEKDLAQLREEGRDTAIVKKAKITKKCIGTTDAGDEINIISHELELHDRRADEIDRVMDRTEGKPQQSVTVESSTPMSVQIITPLSHVDPADANPGR